MYNHYRLSHDFLTGEISQLSTKIKQLEKKSKKSPEDLKSHLKAFLKVSELVNVLCSIMVNDVCTLLFTLNW